MKSYAAVVDPKDVATKEYVDMQLGPAGDSEGTATLDFGAGAKTATVTVTGVTDVDSGSLVDANMLIVATPEHTTDDLLIDPIRLAVLDRVAGVGFTIYGEMPDGEANGTYGVEWSLR